MKLFLTGATGFIGTHLLPKLQNEGHEVVTDFRYFDGERYDTIIHLAAVTHIKQEFDGKLFDANIVLADKIFNRPERIIYASSCSARHQTNPYAYTKLYAEYRGGLHRNSIGLRFFNCYGPGNNKGIVWFLLQQRDGAKINVRGPELVRDYIHVDDLTDQIVHTTCFDFENGIMDVGTGIGTMTMDLVNLYMKLSGKNFFITASEAGDNEPETMVASSRTSHKLNLEQGLLKTING